MSEIAFLIKKRVFTIFLGLPFDGMLKIEDAQILLL